MTIYNADLLTESKIYTPETISFLSLQLQAFLSSNMVIAWENYSVNIGGYIQYSINCHVCYSDSKFSLYLDEHPQLEGDIATRQLPRGLMLDSCIEAIYTMLEELNDRQIQ